MHHASNTFIHRQLLLLLHCYSMSVAVIGDLPKELKAKIPDPEPPRPTNGYTIPVSFPYISPNAKDRVGQAIDKSMISSATPVVRELETALTSFFKVPFAKACSNGYSALVLALKLAKIRPGDHVLIPSFTMAAVTNAVIAIEGRPIFVDCQEGSFNPSVENYRKCLTEKCTALIVTHTYGIPADCDSLVKFCNENKLVFIEDIAEAIGTDYKGRYVGTFGDFATASLYANKTITSGDGGFILSKNPDIKDLQERANSYVNHGFTRDYHFLHFEHCGNYKMSGLQAAMVLPAVSDIPEILQDRLRISQTYRKYLDGILGLSLMPLNPYGEEGPWMFGVMVESKEKRTKVRAIMAEDGIETRDFFFPLHLQPMTLSGSNNDGNRWPFNGHPSLLPNAERLGSTGFYLPTYYNLPEESIKKISDSLIKGLVSV